MTRLSQPPHSHTPLTSSKHFQIAIVNQLYLHAVHSQPGIREESGEWEEMRRRDDLEGDGGMLIGGVDGVIMSRVRECEGEREGEGERECVCV